jgi:hypothetical protein
MGLLGLASIKDCLSISKNAFFLTPILRIGVVPPGSFDEAVHLRRGSRVVKPFF